MAQANQPHYIKKWRQKRGYSLRHLANLMEVEPGGELLISYASLARIESGDQPFSEPILNALAVALDIDRCKLLSHDPFKEGEVIDLLQRLNPKDYEHVTDLIKRLAAL